MYVESFYMIELMKDITFRPGSTDLKTRYLVFKVEYPYVIFLSSSCLTYLCP